MINKENVCLETVRALTDDALPLVDDSAPLTPEEEHLYDQLMRDISKGIKFLQGA